MSLLSSHSVYALPGGVAAVPLTLLPGLHGDVLLHLEDVEEEPRALQTNEGRTGGDREPRGAGKTPLI